MTAASFSTDEESLMRIFENNTISRYKCEFGFGLEA